LKLLKVKIEYLKSIIPLKYLKKNEIITATKPIIISSDSYIIDGHKRVKKLISDNITEVDVLQLNSDKYEAYIEANNHRNLSLFEQYSLYKSGLKIKISGLIPRDYDVLDVIETFSKEELELLIFQEINSKNLVSMLFLKEEKRNYFFKVIDKFNLSNNEIRSFIENLIRVKQDKLVDISSYDKKENLIDNLYKLAKPFIYRNNEIIKKLNTSLPNKTTIRNNNSFELAEFELNLIFKSKIELMEKLDKLKLFVESDKADEMFVSLGE